MGFQSDVREAEVKASIFFRNMLIINERRREGRGHDPASEACRRVAGWHARAYVTREAADALHRRTTSKLILDLHQPSSSDMLLGYTSPKR